MNSNISNSDDAKDYQLLKQVDKIHDNNCPTLQHYFVNIVEFHGLCLCKTMEWHTLMHKISIHHVILSIVGVLGSMSALVVTSSMVTKSSTAVLISVMLLYNILRLSAAGFLATYTFADSRPKAQKICNFMWLVGTWGVNYSLLDLSVEETLVATRPDLATHTVTPVRAVKKTMVVLLLGLLFNSSALVRVVVNVKTGVKQRGNMIMDCVEADYYYAYSWGYNLYVTGVLHFVIPSVLLLMAVGLLIVLFVRARVRDRLTQLSGMDFGTSGVYTITAGYKQQQIFVVLLVGSHVSLIAMYSVTFLRLVICDKHDDDEEMIDTDSQSNLIHGFHSAEICQLISATISPFCLILWPDYRSEAFKTLCGCCSRTDSAPVSNLSASRSAYSLTGFQ